MVAHDHCHAGRQRALDPIDRRLDGGLDLEAVSRSGVTRSADRVTVYNSKHFVSSDSPWRECQILK